MLKVYMYIILQIIIQKKYNSNRINQNISCKHLYKTFFFGLNSPNEYALALDSISYLI